MEILLLKIFATSAIMVIALSLVMIPTDRNDCPSWLVTAVVVAWIASAIVMFVSGIGSIWV